MLQGLVSLFGVSDVLVTKGARRRLPMIAFVPFPGSLTSLGMHDAQRAVIFVTRVRSSFQLQRSVLARF